MTISHVRSLIFWASASAATCLLVACADIDGTNGASVNVQPKEKVWIAFLEAHSLEDTFVSFSGDMPKISLTQTDQEKLKTVSASEIIGFSNANDIVMSSGDPDLIKLHEKMKSAESAMRSSPEYIRLSKATTQLTLVQRAYYNGENQKTMEMIHNGASLPELQAAGANFDREDAQLRLAKQSNPVAQKAEAEGQKAQSAFLKVRQRYTIPASELVNVMQHYLPSGSKAWSSQTLFANDFSYNHATMPPNVADMVKTNSLSLEHGTWTY